MTYFKLFFSYDIELVPLEELEQEWVDEQASQHSPMMLDFEDISEKEDKRETNPFSESDSGDSSNSDADTNSAKTIQIANQTKGYLGKCTPGSPGQLNIYPMST